MLAKTNDTYRKLSKAYTGTLAECREIWRVNNCIPSADLVKCTRGNNDIIYYRPCGGHRINDKIAMFHWNPDGSVTLYL